MSKQTTRWVLVSEGESPDVRIVDDLTESLHAFLCFCKQPWDKCETEDVREMMAETQNPDNWRTDDAGRLFSMDWKLETGRVGIFGFYGELPAETPPPAPDLALPPKEIILALQYVDKPLPLRKCVRCGGSDFREIVHKPLVPDLIFSHCSDDSSSSVPLAICLGCKRLYTRI